MMCFCDRQAIPESLFWVREKDQNDSNDSNDTFEDDIEMLQGFAFVSVSADSESFDMHRLVQVAMQRWLKRQGDQETQVGRLIAKLSVAFPRGNRATGMYVKPCSSTRKHRWAGTSLVKKTFCNGHLYCDAQLSMRHREGEVYFDWKR